jgi:Tol biopolymer transport system component
MRLLSSLRVFCSICFLSDCRETENEPDADTGTFNLSGRVIFSSAGGADLPDGVYVLDLQGSTAVLRSLAPGGVDGRASPDGTRIVYEKVTPQHSQDIYAILLSEGAEADVSNLSQASENDPDISSTGSLIVFSALFASTGESAIFSVSPGGGNPVTITDTTYQHSFLFFSRLSPDGSLVAYIHEAPTEGQYALAIVAIDASGQRDLAESGNLCPPQWSPSGRFIAFAPPANSSAGIAVVDMQTGVTRSIVGGEEMLVANGCVWTQGEELYCFGESPADSLFDIYRSAGPLFHIPVQILRGFGSKSTLLSSPDGKVMGVIGRRGTGGLSLYVMNPDRTLLTKIAQVSLSADIQSGSSAQWVK